LSHLTGVFSSVQIMSMTRVRRRVDLRHLQGLGQSVGGGSLEYRVGIQAAHGAGDLVPVDDLLLCRLGARGKP
jgi:hypothetical protein